MYLKLCETGETAMDKILHRSVRLCCGVEKAFEMFTNNTDLQSWLCSIADVDPRIGGKFELFWNPEDKENDSTIGCKITAIETNKYLSFEWKGPETYKQFMNTADPLTHVVVFFIPCTEEGLPRCTEVHLVHTGWRSTPEWEEARLWFEQAWDMSFTDLQEYAKRIAGDVV